MSFEEIQYNKLPQTKDDLNMKCVVLGDAGVGKTSVIERLSTNTFRERSQSTIGVDYRVICIKGVKPVKVKVWDTAGHERFRSVTQMYYRNTDCVMVVFSLCDRDSLTNVESWVHNLREHNEDNVPILLVGTKDDLSQDDELREESYSMAQELGLHGPIFISSKSMKDKILLNYLKPFFRAIAFASVPKDTTSLEFCTGGRKRFRSIGCCFM